MWEVARKLVAQPLVEAGKEAPATGEDDIAHEHLAHIRVAGRQCLRYERWYCAWDVWIRCLGTDRRFRWQSGEEET